MQLKLLGIQGSTSIAAVTAATKGLSVEESTAALATTNLTESEMAAVLVKNGFSNATALQAAANAVEAREQEAVAAATISAAGAETTATVTTVGLTGATSSLTAAFQGLKAAIASNPLGFFVTIAVTAIVVIASLVSNIQSAAEKLEESANEVKELQDKIAGLNDDLNTTKKRIDELLRKDTLTIVEQAELSRLRKVNAELERQIALENTRLATAKGKNERDFVNSVNDYLNEDNSILGAGHISNENLFKTELGFYLNPNLNDSAKAAAKKWMDEFIPKFSDYTDKLVDYDYSTLSDDAKAAYDKVMDIQNAYLVATSDSFDTVFKSIFNSDRFTAGREALENAAKDGLTAVEVETLYNSNDDVKDMVDNMKDVGLITDTTSESFKGLAAQIEQAEQVTGSIASDAKVAFSDLISNENIQDTVNGFKTKLTELSDALEDYKSGDLSDSDLVELFEKFPELAGRTDDLDTALEELIDSTQTEIDNQFESWAKNMPTDEDADSLNAVKESLDGIANEAKGIKALSAEIDKLSDDLDDLQSVVSNIQDIQENFNDNGYYSTDDLQKLLELEPEYLNLLIDENGQLNLNSQAYKDYMTAKAKSLLLDQVTSLYESILGMSIEEAQAYAAAEAYDEESNSIEKLTKHYLALAQAKDVANNTTAYTDAMKQSFKTVANYAAIYDSWLSSLNSSTNEFTKKTNSSTSALEAQKEALQDSKDALEAQKDALEDAKDALEDYKDALEGAQDDIQDLIDLVIDYIKQTKENEKDAIQSSIDSLEDKKDALDEQKDAYSDLIAKRKEEIEALYEEKKAQDELSEKQKSAAKDALSLAIAQLDNSSAGKRAQKQAQDNYDSSRKDLKDYLDEQAKDKRIAALEEEETRYEEMIEKQKTAIDKQVEHLEAKIDEIDDYLANSRKLYEDACYMIDNDNGTLYANLWNYTYTYTTKTKAEFDNLWTSAQTAIRIYKGDNDTLIGTMEMLQGKIYDTDRQIDNLNTQIDECETQIGNLDDAISSTSDAINSTSGAIDNVSSSLGGLSSSIADYVAQLNALANADLGNDNQDKTSFWVNYNGKKYSTGYNYSGDTKNNRLLAANELTKLIAKDVSGFDQYGLGIIQGLLGVGNGNSKGWYYNFDGRTYTATSSSKDNAVKQIRQQLAERYGNSSFVLDQVYGKIKHYSSGTRNSNSLAITQEDGFEAIFGKLSKGQYTMMPQGSQVFTAAQTDNLYGFASDPQKFINDIIGKTSSFLLSRYSGYKDGIGNVTNQVTKNSGDTILNFAPVTNIQGNADRTTVSQMDELYEKYKRRFMLEMLREKNNI